MTRLQAFCPHVAQVIPLGRRHVSFVHGIKSRPCKCMASSNDGAERGDSKSAENSFAMVRTACMPLSSIANV